MSESVFTLVGALGRKYLTAQERTRFLVAARVDPRPAVQTFAATLAHTGARISEVLAIRAGDVDLESCEVRIATLERRREHWRSVPVPEALIYDLELVHRLRRTQASPRGRRTRLWPVSRATGGERSSRVVGIGPAVALCHG